MSAYHLPWGLGGGHLADETVLVHGPPLLPVVHRRLGPHLLLLGISAVKPRTVIAHTTFSRIMLQCLSNAFTLASLPHQHQPPRESKWTNSFRFDRMLISTCE